MPAFEANYRLILVQPDPFRLPEIRQCQFQRVSISDFERAAAGPARMKRGDVDLGIGQGAPLEAQRRHEIVAGSELMLTLAGCRMDPQELLGGHLRDS